MIRPMRTFVKGAGFSAYLISSLTVKDDGSYDFTNATPIVLTENEEKRNVYR